MDNEDKLSQINEGRTAHMFFSWAAPIFDDVEKSLIASMKSNFRLGTYSELLLACHTAQLCALDDLKTRIKGLAVRGDSAAHQMNEQSEEGDYE